jgi:hypothetical protein
VKVAVVRTDTQTRRILGVIDPQIFLQTTQASGSDVITDKKLALLSFKELGQFTGRGSS